MIIEVKAAQLRLLTFKWDESADVSSVVSSLYLLGIIILVNLKENFYFALHLRLLLEVKMLLGR